MNRNALVWGAAGGIGRALVAKLTAEQWRVFAAGHGASAVDLAAQAFEAEAAEPFAVQRVAMEVGQEAGEIDLFVYAAGDIASQPTAALRPEAWQRIVDANLTGAYVTTHYSLPLLTPEAALVYLGAVSERLKLPGLGAYVAAKAGLEAWVEALRKEERHRRVILVRPGAVDTAFWRKVPFRMPASARQADAVAAAILEAYHSGHRGNLDL
jgi:NAD(P)-dependent dehydrogenase (short-subunit alcohol dehydrogenase family)